MKPKKKKHWQYQEGSNQVQGSDRKKVRQELMVKMREEVPYNNPLILFNVLIYLIIFRSIFFLQVDADFKAVSFAPDLEERQRMQSETLSTIFETYFRILKHSMDLSVSRYASYWKSVGAASLHHDKGGQYSYLNIVPYNNQKKKKSLSRK